MKKSYYVYILASRWRGATYIGVTNDLHMRLQEHRDPKSTGYAKKWSIAKLVYLEEFKYINDAIAYEKKLKKWRKPWKFDLIENNNLDWLDLFEFYPNDL